MDWRRSTGNKQCRDTGMSDTLRLCHYYTLHEQRMRLGMQRYLLIYNYNQLMIQYNGIIRIRPESWQRTSLSDSLSPNFCSGIHCLSTLQSLGCNWYL